MSELFYMQDTRPNRTVGNCITLWAKDHKGYTCDLDRAHLFTKEEAEEIHKSRRTDRPWPKELLDSLAYRHVDHQRLPKRPLEDSSKLPEDRIIR